MNTQLQIAYWIVTFSSFLLNLHTSYLSEISKTSGIGKYFIQRQEMRINIDIIMMLETYDVIHNL